MTDNSISKSQITEDLLKRLDELKTREDEFFLRHGFIYETTNEHGIASTAHMNWKWAVEKELKKMGNSNFMGTPMARKMFVLGFLTARDQE